MYWAKDTVQTLRTDRYQLTREIQDTLHSKHLGDYSKTVLSKQGKTPQVQ